MSGCAWNDPLDKAGHDFALGVSLIAIECAEDIGDPVAFAPRARATPPLRIALCAATRLSS